MKDTRPGIFAAVGVAALVGGDLGDYVAQTDHQACHKAAPGYNPPGVEVTNKGSWIANQAHCATYHAALAATVGVACATLGIKVSPWRAAAALALSWSTHGIVDRRWPVEKIMKATGSAPYYPAGAPFVDQTVHKTVLIACALIIAA